MRSKFRGRILNFFASLCLHGTSFYNAETQENSKNGKVEDYESAMTGVEGNVVLDRLVLPAVEVGGHEADGQAGEAGEKKMEAEGSADLLMSLFLAPQGALVVIAFLITPSFSSKPLTHADILL